jgi:hypothetical protein
MSNEVLNWAKRVVVGGQTRKAVFLLLADYADDKGRAWPSQETVAETLEMSERTVRSAIAALVEDGLLSRKPRWRPDGTRGTDILKFDMDLVNRQEIPVNGEQPANDSRTTGKSRRNNRQMPPNQPAGDAGLEPSLEPSLDPSLNVSEATASGRPAIAAQPVDLSDKDRLWAEGRPSLMECGLSHKQAGDMIGRWLGTYRDPVAILAAIWAARSEGTQSPIGYVVAVLEAPDRKARASPHAKPKTAGAFLTDLANGVFSGGMDDERSEAQPPQLRLIAGSRH